MLSLPAQTLPAPDSIAVSGLARARPPARDAIRLVRLALLAWPSHDVLTGDGVQAGGCSRAYATYVVEQVAEGACRAGRDPRELDVATYAITAVAEDAEAARLAARAMVAGWMPTLPRKLIVRHGFDERGIDPIVNAMGRGDAQEALRRIPDELVDALAVAGTPEECVDKIRRDLVEPGIGHIIMGIADPGLVAAVAGADVSVPDVRGQLSLIGDRVIPALAGVSPAK